MNLNSTILLLVLYLVCVNVACSRRHKRLPARLPKSRQQNVGIRISGPKRNRDGGVHVESIPNPIVSTADLYKLLRVSIGNQPNDNKRLQGTRRAKRLYCRVGIGYHLEIKRNGKVVARHRATDDGRLEIFSVKRGVVGIRSKTHNRYLCMNKRGKLITRKSFKSDCSFREKMEGNGFNTYASEKFSKKRRGYFLAISKRGKPKRGRNVSWREKKAHWLPRDITPTP